MESNTSFSQIVNLADNQNINDKLREMEHIPGVRRINFATPTPIADVVYMNANEILIVKADFLPLEEASQFWLSDDGEDSLNEWRFFSKSNQRVSPVSLAVKTRTFYYRFFPAPDFNIYALVLCNYPIINYADKQKFWDIIAVKVLQNVDDESCPIRSKSDISFRPQNATEEEFDEILNSFMECNPDNDFQAEDSTSSSLEETDEKLANNDRQSDSELFEGYSPFLLPLEQFWPRKAELYACHPISSGQWLPDEKAQKSFSLKSLKAIYVHYEANSATKKIDGVRFECDLYSETGILMNHQEIKGTKIVVDEDDEGAQLHLDFTCGVVSAIKWEEGRYLLDIKCQSFPLINLIFHVGANDEEGAYLFEQKRIGEAPTIKQDFDELIGLTQVKEQLDRYQHRIQMAQKRSLMGLQAEKPILHAVFMGNTGTGKSTVASLYGQMLKEMGVLSKGHVVTENRSTLLGSAYNVEQENLKEAIEKAQGGVLLIDEAYQLYKADDPRDPGHNAINTLMSVMEKGNGNWALLLAGYPSQMNGFLTANQGLASRIPKQNIFQFPDYTVDELMAIADHFCDTHNYLLTSDARKALYNKVTRDYNRRDNTFGNARYILSLLKEEVLQAMSLRISTIQKTTLLQLITIEKSDIPSWTIRNTSAAMQKLQSLVGLSNLKQSIETHLNYVKMTQLRIEMGIPTDTPPLHMIFTGNPGTGKSTVADLIGEIYASMGLLSVGRVIRVERKDLVGQYIGETEQKTAQVIKSAKGNVLFIDEAYTLLGGSKSNEKDFGHRAMEMLLQVLERDHADILVILAGYSDEMNLLLKLNPGLASRIPYTFHFEDYSVDELMTIGVSMVEEMKYKFSSSALKALRKLVEEKLKNRDEHWGNARFIKRLITTRVIPAMSNRLMQLSPEKLKDNKVLLTITPADIPSDADDIFSSSRAVIDEKSVAAILAQVDELVGLDQVKQNLHGFVDAIRYLHKQGLPLTKYGSLRWTFTGNTGTGKSTVAALLGELLRAIGILDRGHLVEIKAEELYQLSEYKLEEQLRDAMKRSAEGVLFIDGDAPLFSRSDSRFSSDNLRFKLSSMMAGMSGTHAIVIAEHEPRTASLAQSLRDTGIPSFNHTYYFSDYTEEELMRILLQCLKYQHLTPNPAAATLLQEYIQGLCLRRDLGYANARTMKLIVDSIAHNCWQRGSKDGAKVVKEMTVEDVKGFVWKGGMRGERIGFK